MRGQASLEFLTTYGWAFLIMLVMIGAVSYFGVTQPQLFLPERCTFGAEVQCDDFLLTDAQVDGGEAGVLLVTMRQTLGRTAYLEDFSCEPPRQGVEVKGYYQSGSDYGSTSNLFRSDVQEELSEEFRQWDPSEDVTLKCLFSAAGSNPYAGLAGESVRVPVTVTLLKRADGFPHRVEGEIVGVIQ